jgi:peptidoglycan/LPS O-acetylase OafA/YrhL
MQNLLFLHALRGIAALYVLILHFFRIASIDIPAWAGNFVIGGRSGVYLFFIVSAFSLMYTMPRHMQHIKPMWSYAISRLFRIAPLFYLFIAIMLIRYSQNNDAFSILTNMAFINNLFNGQESSIVWAGWTISVEMLFYLSVPYLFLNVRNITQAIWLLVITFCIASMSFLLFNHLGYSSWWKLSIFRYLPVFALGIFTYLIYRDHLTKEIIARYGKAANYLTLLAPVTILLGLDNIYFSGVYLVSIGYAAILIALSIKQYPLAVNRITCFYGMFSFPIYLSHPLVIYYSKPIYERIYGLGYHQSISILIGLLFTIASVTLVAYVLHIFIEQPGIKLGKLLINKTYEKRLIIN